MSKSSPEEQAARILKRLDTSMKKAAEAGIGVHSLIGETVVALLHEEAAISKSSVLKALEHLLAQTKRAKDPEAVYDPDFHTISEALKIVREVPDIP